MHCPNDIGCKHKKWTGSKTGNGVVGLTEGEKSQPALLYIKRKKPRSRDEHLDKNFQDEWMNGRTIEKEKYLML